MNKRRERVALPSAEYLLECFTCDWSTGDLTWLVRPKEHFKDLRAWSSANIRFAGKAAGSIKSDGYCRICIDVQLYLRSRLIWKIVTGLDPIQEIDHVDGNRSNDAWLNLREADYSGQAWNSTRKKNNTSGYRGVSRVGKKWTARITIDGVYRHLGMYSTLEEASAAYEAMAGKLHGKFFLPHGIRT